MGHGRKLPFEIWRPIGKLSARVREIIGKIGCLANWLVAIAVSHAAMAGAREHNACELPIYIGHMYWFSAMYKVFLVNPLYEFGLSDVD